MTWPKRSRPKHPRPRPPKPPPPRMRPSRTPPPPHTPTLSHRTTLLIHRQNRKSQRHRPSRRSEEHTSELQSLMRISYAVFCLKKKKKNTLRSHTNTAIDMTH